MTFTERCYRQLWLYFRTCWQNPNGNEISLTITNHWEPMPTVITLFTAHLLQFHSFRPSPFFRKKTMGLWLKGYSKLRVTQIKRKNTVRISRVIFVWKGPDKKMVFIWQIGKDDKMILWEGVGGRGVIHTNMPDAGDRRCAIHQLFLNSSSSHQYQSIMSPSSM